MKGNGRKQDKPSIADRLQALEILVSENLRDLTGRVTQLERYAADQNPIDLGGIRSQLAAARKQAMLGFGNHPPPKPTRISRSSGR